MCGRFTLRANPKALNELVPLFEHVQILPRFNIAPTQEVLAVRQRATQSPPEAVALRWGLVPHWSPDAKAGFINARAETLATKPVFRSAYRERRCLVLADGFYEWQKLDGRRQPFYIRMRDEEPFAFAGLWEHWEKEGEILESCTIVTTDANEVVSPLHNRMPVILARQDYGRWLNPNLHEDDDLQPLLRPYSAEAMTAFPVSTRVNSTRNDEPACIERVQVVEEPGLLF